MNGELSLREALHWFAAASTHAGDVREGARIASRALGRSVAIEQCLTDGPSLPAAERLEIYHAGYFGRLVECLADDYPALAYLLGEDGFSSLARAYIEKFPSRSPSLNAYGAGMAAFCRAWPDPRAPFATDLARLEWALVEVVHAPSVSGLDASALSALPAERWQTARFTPSPTLRLLRFDFPVNEYFQDFRDGAEPRLPERRATATVVNRRGLPVERMDLEPVAALLLEDLLAGCPLDSAIAELERRARGVPDLAEKLPAWLGSWVLNGFFAAIDG
jgi:hypothetical protein